MTENRTPRRRNSPQPPLAGRLPGLRSGPTAGRPPGLFPRGAFFPLGMLVPLCVIGCGRGPAPAPTPRAAPAAVVYDVTPPIPRPAPAAGGYLGSAACQECHEAIAQQYRAHPMGHSMQGPAGELESYELPPFRAGGCEYQVEREGEQIRHHERLRNRDGTVVYDDAQEIAFTVGSGRHGRSYLINRHGRLFMSSISWYSEVSAWDLSPGYSRQNPQRFNRRVTDTCIVCHAGQLALVPDRPHVYQAAPFEELAIGCERCHGPGQAHVALRRAGATGQDVADRDPIVNPGKLDAELRESVCNQCHLQGRQSVPRYGKRPFDFRPGEPLHDTVTVLIDGTGIEGQRTRIVSHVQQMRVSACFTNSDGALGCISCHDPHQTPPPATAAMYYRNRCLSCHETNACGLPEVQRRAKHADDSCIACHMPQLPTQNVAHLALTDHRILASPAAAAAAPRSAAPQPQPTPSRRSPLERLAGGLQIFDPAHQRLAQWERDRAVALGTAWELENGGGADRDAAAELIRTLQAVVKLVPDDTLSLAALGQLAARVQDFDLAKQALGQCLEVNAEDEAALRAMILVGFQSGDFELGVAHAKRLLKLTPWDDTAWGQQAVMLGQLNRVPESLEAARQGLRHNPRHTELRRWLVAALRAQGETAEANRQQGLLEQIQASLRMPAEPGAR